MKERFSKIVLTGVMSLLLGTSVSHLFAFEGRQGPGWRGDGCYDSCCQSRDSCCEEPRFAIWGDWIYWDVCENDSDTSITDQVGVAGAPNSLVNAETKFLEYGYKSGFRIGASYRLPCDCWSVEAIWTRYHPKWHQTDTPSLGGKAVPTQSPNFQVGRAPFAEAETQLKLKYDLLDVLFAKTFRWGDCFKVRPYGGLRFVWLKKRWSTEYNTALNNSTSGEPPFNVASGDSVEDRWIVDLPAGGAAIGFEGKYAICEGISLTGHFGTAILGGRVQHHHDWFNQTTGQWFTEKRHHCQFLGEWDASIGLAYDSIFCDCPWFVNIGYEITDWWNTPVNPRFVNGGPTGDLSLGQITRDSSGRLTLHGLFVRAGTTF